ncbi:hypothetical protein GCM10027598_58590 [Amycolatopsis oliviviridis]|uniref:Uncharacterized protein n=1 Tax=Amycolatopsis oliviviridis TaxID=1471590 RepID=A0ABQ3LX87_9PSEU|nr:hypothetical protein [Amycolatopsis oliviviridis]GHH28428.1 hypothetical protein GCM10017790_59240 [Amycolatopsis oliviviridis]
MSHPLSFELHETLLRVAGWLPDEQLSTARSLLAEGRCGEAASLIAFAGRRTVLPLIDDDLDTLAELLEEEGRDPAVLDAVELAADNAPLLWRFSAEWNTSDEAEENDEKNQTMLVAAFAEQDLLAAVGEEPGVRALWSAIRRPADESPYPRPRVVYVVEVDDDEIDGLGELTGRLQERLIAAGERDPQVELLSMYGGWPTYQRAVRAMGRLLWAADADVEIRVAKIFDEVDPESGPSFSPDRAKIVDEEFRASLIDYLKAGTELLVTTATLEDVVEPAKGSVVPMSFRTDGAWVWTDAVSYYLENYQLTPDPELVEHIQLADGPPSAIDSVARRRAMDALRPSPDNQPVWSGS